MAARKKAKAKKRGSWGGRRKGAGRPKGSGQGPSPDSRRNRVAVLLDDDQWEKLVLRADDKGLPVATLAYQYVARGLKGKR